MCCEGVYRKEVERLAGCCSDNNLVLNVSETKEMIIDFPQGKESDSLPND